MSAHTVLDHVDQYLRLGQEYGCSDVHLATAYPPAWRRNGLLQPIWEDHAPLTSEETDKLAQSFLGHKEWARLKEKGDVDFAYDNGEGRFRASVVRQRLRKSAYRSTTFSLSPATTTASSSSLDPSAQENPPPSPR